MATILILSHPAPGCTGPTYRTEYSETEWASGDCGALYDPATRASLDRGERVRIEDRIFVNPIAFYQRATATCDASHITGLAA